MRSLLQLALHEADDLVFPLSLESVCLWLLAGWRSGGEFL